MPIHLDTPAPLESPASLLLNAILICVGGTLPGVFFPDSFGLSNMAVTRFIWFTFRQYKRLFRVVIAHMRLPESTPDNAAATANGTSR